jgi:hypothetical protein
MHWPSSRDSTINLPRHRAKPVLADSVLGVLFMVRRDYAYPRGRQICEAARHATAALII